MVERCGVLAERKNWQTRDVKVKAEVHSFLGQGRGLTLSKEESLFGLYYTASVVLFVCSWNSRGLRDPSDPAW